jgi:ion channel-forming bestrophin family protein
MVWISDLRGGCLFGMRPCGYCAPVHTPQKTWLLLSPKQALPTTQRHMQWTASTFTAMHTYEPRSWLRPVLEFHRADTVRKLLPMILAIGAYTALVAWVDLVWLDLSDDVLVKNLPVMHSLLGFAISMLLVFRTNTAYDRWWEGRKHWGALVNVTRNLAVKLDAWLPGAEPQRRAFAALLGQFAHELRRHLLRENTRLELDETAHPELPQLDRTRHTPTQVVQALHEQVRKARMKGMLDEQCFLLLHQDMNALLDICGACERIKNTPIPYSYSAFIKKFIVVYSVTLPLGFVFTLGWIAVPVVIFIFYVLASLEIIAEEIEDPFGEDGNDLPMLRMAEVINENVLRVLGPANGTSNPGTS